MDEQRKKFFEEGSRLIDSVNRLMLFVALLVFYFLITPILYKIEKSSRTTTVQVEALNSEVKTLEQLLQQEMRNPNKWPQPIHQLKALSPQQ